MTNSIHDINSQTPEAYARVIADQYLHDLVEPKEMYAFIGANDSYYVIHRFCSIADLFYINADLWSGDIYDRKWFAALLASAMRMVMANTISGDKSGKARTLFLEIIEHVAMQEAEERFERP